MSTEEEEEEEEELYDGEEYSYEYEVSNCQVRCKLTFLIIWLVHIINPNYCINSEGGHPMTSPFLVHLRDQGWNDTFSSRGCPLPTPILWVL